MEFRQRAMHHLKFLIPQEFPNPPKFIAYLNMHKEAKRAAFLLKHRAEVT